MARRGCGMRGPAEQLDGGGNRGGTRLIGFRLSLSSYLSPAPESVHTDEMFSPWSRRVGFEWALLVSN